VQANAFRAFARRRRKWYNSTLEDLEDMDEILRARAEQEEVIPWDQAKAELRAEGVDV
jgi:hypothetical protein